MLRSRLRSAASITVLFSCFAVLPATALAAPPNDNWANRIAIPSRVVGGPAYTDAQAGVQTATVETTDPNSPCGFTSTNLRDYSQSLWYSYTTGAATEYLRARTTRVGGTTDTVLGIYTGAPGSFEPVPGGCGDDVIMSAAQASGVRLAPNTSYSILVASFGTGSSSAGTMTTTVDAPANYTVTKTTDDAPDGCTVADCSLREAVAALNASSVDSRGAVLVPPGTYDLTRGGADDTNTAGDLDLTVIGASVHATGAGVIVRQGVTGERVLQATQKLATLTGMQMTSGTPTGLTAGDSFGGAVYSSGVSAEPLTLSQMTLTGNTATDGGGLNAAGRAWVDRTSITGNVATGNGGGAAVTGSNNTAITRSTVSGNSSAGASGGGGLYYTPANVLLIDESTFANNSANASGGGILMNANIAGTRLISSTIADNRADADGNATGAGGGLSITAGTTQTLRGLVLSRNLVGSGAVAGDCASTAALTATSFDYVEVPGTCGFTGTGDQTGGSALLGPLADNGGQTQTLSPLPGSPVIDTGPASCLKGGYALATDVQTRDQRDFQRTVNGDADPSVVCDKGSVEFAALSSAGWRGGRARLTRRGVVVRWRFARVDDVVSFDVVRVRRGHRVRVATVDGPAVSRRSAFRVHDGRGRAGDRYLIRARGTDGRGTLHGPLRVRR